MSSILEQTRAHAPPTRYCEISFRARLGANEAEEEEDVPGVLPFLALALCGTDDDDGPPLANLFAIAVFVLRLVLALALAVIDVPAVL